MACRNQILTRPRSWRAMVFGGAALAACIGGCSSAGQLYRFFLTPCPVHGPVAETELPMRIEPVALAAYYQELSSAAAGFDLREVARVRDVSGDLPIYHIAHIARLAPDTAARATRLLVVAGVHGNEIAGALAAPRVLADMETRPTDYQDVDLHLIAPANPVGLGHLSRYDALGCDVNRDFGAFRTPEATAIRAVFAAVAPDLVIALHEGPQDGFCVIATQSVPPRLTEAVAEAVGRTGVPLAQDSFLGLPLGTPGVMREGRFMTALKRAIGLQSLGAYALAQGVPTLTTESPWNGADLDARITTHVIAVRAAVQQLRGVHGGAE